MALVRVNMCLLAMPRLVSDPKFEIIQLIILPLLTDPST